jgi:hypothetical protein
MTALTIILGGEKLEGKILKRMQENDQELYWHNNHA